MAIFNDTVNPVNLSQGLVINPDELFLHPGNLAEKSVLSFTAPNAGCYQYSATFDLMDLQNGDVDVTVCAPSGVVYSDAFSGAGTTSDVSLTNLYLSANESVAVYVGDGGDDHLYDSLRTSVEVDVAPAASCGTDLAITKSDGVTTATPGGNLTYTIVASNMGLNPDFSVNVTDALPAALTCTYTSATAGGATGNTVSGSGDLNETLSMPAGSSVTYTLNCSIDPTATGTLSNTATISGTVSDITPGNNTATDSDTVLVSTSADLSVTKNDGVTSATPGGTLTYTIVASNAGPGDDPLVNLTDTLPAALTCTYDSVAVGGATGNTVSGSGDLDETLSMPAGSSVTYTLNCGIDPAATGTLSNTAAISGSTTDTSPVNNSATDGNTILQPAAMSSPRPVPTLGALGWFLLSLIVLGAARRRSIR